MFDIRWHQGTLPLSCRVCSWTGDGEHVADFSHPEADTIPGIRCRECGSIDLAPEPRDFSPDDDRVDAYVEGGVGLEEIASCLAQVDADQVRRFLDVGCNYGFALDLGRFLHDWEVVGVEPSLAGRRGATEFGLDIRNSYLDDGVKLGEPFDLVLASEVLEHVTDPLGFLKVLSAQLKPTGTLLLTTPAAEVITPSEPEVEVAAAVSLGFHTFVASSKGLRWLLERAGFSSIRISREGRSLWAIACADPEADLPAGERPQAPDLVGYFNDRADSAPRGSALALGMAVRHVRAIVNQGRWPEAQASALRAITTMRDRHGLDLSQPQQVERAIQTRESVPGSLPALAFSLGMRALLDTADAAGAADYFKVVADAADQWERKGYLDLDMVDLGFQARVHRAIALAGTNPQDAAALALDLSNRHDHALGVVPLASRQARILVTISSHGHYDAASRLIDIVNPHLDALLASGQEDARHTALDALLSIGILKLNTGEPAVAREWFARCAAASEAVGGPVGDRMASEAYRHLALAGGDAAEVSAIRLRTARTHHCLDVYWTDAAGTYLEGWALAEGLATHRTEVRSRSGSVTASPMRRDDLRAIFPQQDKAEEAGFTAYLPHPVASAELVLHTDRGAIEIPLELSGPRPPLEQFDAPQEQRDRLLDYVDTLPDGPILMIGQRKSAAWEWERIVAPYGGRQVIGLDVHPGHGVHVIGDAHQLSRIFRSESFAAVVSLSVLEHVVAPWLVAAECAKVLKHGGLTFQIAPWLWPTHSQPNDFWRFSPEGLQQLFGPALGFEHVASGGEYGVVAMPAPDWRERNPRMATLASPAMSWLIARKVAEPDASAEWPYDPEAGARSARAYPEGGLAPEGFQFGGKA